ncbi:MAG: hypothetical protein EZS28_007600 [Streblomastix strix]|uniref:Uncharacterized protein n=1 Tax=Streblomastix strix TaxID=222440 RepID=A0A5J4WPG4_9EUKA|nr:MAG: hypothetical protein EZS28_007600 [Streblomastix strix]
MKSPTITEVEPQFEKEIDPFQQLSFSNQFQQQVLRCETPTLSARRRSSIFEETLTPNPQVVAYTFDVQESQIQLSIEDEACYEINATKTFNANVNAIGSVKTGKDDTSDLLTGGGDRLLSAFGGIEDLTQSAFSDLNTAIIQCKLIRIGNQYIFSLLAKGGNYDARTNNPNYLVYG